MRWGEPPPHNLPHPDDLVFEEGKKVSIGWTPERAANTQPAKLHVKQLQKYIAAVIATLERRI